MMTRIALLPLLMAMTMVKPVTTMMMMMMMLLLL